MEKKTTDVLIIGGAVSGSAMACALARFNIDVTLVDRRKEPNGLNRGDGLQPRTQEIMESWGVLEHFHQYPFVKSYGLDIRRTNGTRVLLIDMKQLKDLKYNYIFSMPHRYIEEHFLEWADQHNHIHMWRGYTAKELVYGQSGKVEGAILQDRSGDQVEIRAKVVVGADGGQSFVRKSLNIPTTQEVYDHQLIVAHLPLPSWYGELRNHVYLHKDGAIVLLPLPDQKMRMAVVLEPGQISTWTKYTDEELMAKVSERLPLLKGLEVYREHEHAYKMTRMHAISYSKNGAVLVGDAAHLTHASSGQGMNMAIQDADVLSLLLKEALEGNMDLDHALLLYEHIRRPINEEIMGRAHFMSSMVYNKTPLEYNSKILRFSALKLVPGLLNKMGTEMARGISGMKQVPIIEKQLSTALG
ncbi:FAD-dependent oxidoreductase [Brevibacillus fulvus]|uniref:2-polyprenyl-6-methoxyphenol hydroxylase-like FAD-dependent oxidoreductase n=1 Tax=Brevibacillus fulvus TaxID=1125967 RepID=A0A939BTJ9_9BACL|nr:NAD(P)/FAD-dependent oxidoreductase [Brevibacillus fulvus]MBM7589549.1 2-polyprenyl-6-methoxyphenol hydroxylase-like FAD-dependent oxidoreductase [Brevibacillus fulvus]